MTILFVITHIFGSSDDFIRQLPRLPRHDLCKAPAKLPRNPAEAPAKPRPGHGETPGGSREAPTRLCRGSVMRRVEKIPPMR